MRILVTGICGFVGSTIAEQLLLTRPRIEVLGVDNLIRPGSEGNRPRIRQLGIELFHGDLRLASDVDALPRADWVIDAAANPSVLSGVDGKVSSRQLMEHNLQVTVNMLEYCKRHRAGVVLLSSSRVYSIKPLAELPVTVRDGAFALEKDHPLPQGVTEHGVDETFSSLPPISLYGAAKLASETLALEYGSAFDFPVWVNRCGVLAGAGQFGRPDQGIFSFWIHSYLRRRQLKYIGFGGQGYQVRDCLHPRDLVPLILKQVDAPNRRADERIVNISGGRKSAMSLRQLSDWCAQRFCIHEIQVDPQPRAFDIPWIVLDSSKAAHSWGWSPEVPLHAILEEIAAFAETRSDWLDMSAP